MDETMQNFMRNAQRMGLCKEYTDKCSAAKSKKQLMDIALDANGISYIANAVAKGYLSAEYIYNAFNPFINGKYVRDKDGYTSCLYCSHGHEDDIAEIQANTTAMVVINLIGTIVIPENRICEIHLVNSKCYIKGEGRGNVYTYGDTEIYNEKDAPIKLEQQ